MKWTGKKPGGGKGRVRSRMRGDLLTSKIEDLKQALYSGPVKTYTKKEIEEFTKSRNPEREAEG